MVSAFGDEGDPSTDQGELKSRVSVGKITIFIFGAEGSGDMGEKNLVWVSVVRSFHG